MEKFKAFFAQPYRGEEMDWKGWFLFFGFLILISLGWTIILGTIHNIIAEKEA